MMALGDWVRTLSCFLTAAFISIHCGVGVGARVRIGRPYIIVLHVDPDFLVRSFFIRHLDLSVYVNTTCQYNADA